MRVQVKFVNREIAVKEPFVQSASRECPLEVAEPVWLQSDLYGGRYILRPL